MENEFRKFAEWLLRDYQVDDEYVDSLARQLKSDVDFWFTANREDLAPLRKQGLERFHAGPDTREK